MIVKWGSPPKFHGDPDILLALAAPAAYGSASGMQVVRSSRNDTSSPLRSLPPQPVGPAVPHAVNPISRPSGGAHEDRLDRVRQRSRSPLLMPAPILNFDGISFAQTDGSEPPDTNGEVGATQYVQSVNASFEVFNKQTGASEFGPVGIGTLWDGFGGVCENNSEGDPVVLYDQLADRWLVSQFGGEEEVMTDECIAVSTGPDAAGSYHRYDFHLGSEYYDYPKLAVWPDAYYMSTNVEDADQPFAFDRAKMLAGEAADFVTPGPKSEPALDLPADLDGSTLPPAGAPETFTAWPASGHYDLYHFHVDWSSPSSSTFTHFAEPEAAGFSELCPGETFDCVPQKGTSQRVDALANFRTLMFRAAYRNFGDHESLVFNYTVKSGEVAAVRWVELRGINSGTPFVYQESTYQPDSTWRWLGSSAMDSAGDMAIGFSASSSSIYPEIRYAGRLAGDPLNTLTQGERTLIAGGGSNTEGNRWGDYSDMTVDPVDDCTFWYTNEYYATSGHEWHTRIGSFRFPSCVRRSLAVARTGAGAGTVTSSPAGIDCGSICEAQFAGGKTVTLTAAAASGSRFGGWSGCDSQLSAEQCVVTLDADASVSAEFSLEQPSEPGGGGSGGSSGGGADAAGQAGPVAKVPAFGTSAGVTVRPLRSRVGLGGKEPILVRNSNPFPISGRLALWSAGKAPRRARRHHTRARHLRLAVGSPRVGAGSATVLRLRLTRRAKRALAAHGHLRVLLKAVVRDPQGDKRTVRRRFTLRLPRNLHRHQHLPRPVA